MKIGKGQYEKNTQYLQAPQAAQLRYGVELGYNQTFLAPSNVPSHELECWKSIFHLSLDLILETLYGEYTKKHNIKVQMLHMLLIIMHR